MRLAREDSRLLARRIGVRSLHDLGFESALAGLASGRVSDHAGLLRDRCLLNDGDEGKGAYQCSCHRSIREGWCRLRRLVERVSQCRAKSSFTIDSFRERRDEARTIALWQRLLSDGLYVNLIVPPGCPVDDCVLRASCSAAHTPEHLARALDILGRVGAELGVTRVALS